MAAVVAGAVCLGCTEGITIKTHRCAGDAELLPYGGHCGCPRPGCGPNPARVTSLDLRS